MIDPKLRARILAFVGADGCTGRAIHDEFRGRNIGPVLKDMTRDGSIEVVGHGYRIGAPVVADDSAARAHFAAHGALGARIVELAAGRVTLTDLLSRPRDKDVSRARGYIASQLHGTNEEVAAALGVSPKTIAVYRGQVAA